VPLFDAIEHVRRGIGWQPDRGQASAARPWGVECATAYKTDFGGSRAAPLTSRDALRRPLAVFLRGDGRARLQYVVFSLGADPKG